MRQREARFAQLNYTNRQVLFNLDAALIYTFSIYIFSGQLCLYCYFDFDFILFGAFYFRGLSAYPCHFLPFKNTGDLLAAPMWGRGHTFAQTHPNMRVTGVHRRGIPSTSIGIPLS